MVVSSTKKKSVRARYVRRGYYRRLQRTITQSGYYTAMHDGIEHAGYLAFVGLLAIFPFLIIVVALAGSLGQTQVSDEVVKILTNHLPQGVIAAITPRIKEIVSGPPQGLLPLSVAAMIWTASSSVEGLRTILNRVYHVQNPPSYVWRRLLSIAQFLIFVLALFIATALLLLLPVFFAFIQDTTVWHFLTEYWHIAPKLTPVWDVVRVVLGWALLIFAIAASYYYIPNIQQRWRSVMPGTGIVLVGGWGCIQLLMLYIKSFNQVNIVYGSLGGVVVWLLFLFMLGVVYIFGAEFNYFYEKEMKGQRFKQKEK